MKIRRLTAENIKRIVVVDIMPDGNLVQITGANGSGKSSLLDSIWWALQGATNVAIQPIREGEERASIRLDLGDIIVTRKFALREDGTAATNLIVESVDGARYASPQKMLDELLGALAFDPLAFTRMPPKVQLETLRRLVTLDVDIDALDAANARDYGERTDINRRVKAAEGRVNTLLIGVDPSASVDVVDVAVLLDKMQQAAAHNENAVRINNERAEYQRQATVLYDQADELARRAAEMVAQCDAKRAAALDFEAMVTDLKPVGSIDISELRAKIAEAEATNARALLQRDQREKHEVAKAELGALFSASHRLTADMGERESRKRAAIAGATMPVPGLSFGDGFVTFNGLPLAQASSAEQLRVSFAIAVSQSPKLSVALIKDGSLMDEHSLKLLGEMAAERDFQVWVESVNTGAVGVHMVDGQVASITPAGVS